MKEYVPNALLVNMRKQTIVAVILAKMVQSLKYQGAHKIVVLNVLQEHLHFWITVLAGSVPVVEYLKQVKKNITKIMI